MEKMDKGTLHSIIQCYVIDSLIEEILDNGDKEYSDLKYFQKTALCKLMIKKGKLFGKVNA